MGKRTLMGLGLTKPPTPGEGREAYLSQVKTVAILSYGDQQPTQKAKGEGNTPVLTEGREHDFLN